MPFASYNAMRKTRILSRKPHLRQSNTSRPIRVLSTFALKFPPLNALDHESLDLVLKSADLAHEVRRLVGGDAAADHGAGDTAGTAKSHLAGDIDLV